MQVHYSSDGETPRFFSLEDLISNFKENGVFLTVYRTNEADMRDELATRGWYEGNHNFGRFLVINLDKMNLMSRPADYHKMAKLGR
jgi:hypothetical protein